MYLLRLWDIWKMGHCAWFLGMLSLGVFWASFIWLLKMSRSSSMSLKPSGGGLRFEACLIAGIFRLSELENLTCCQGERTSVLRIEVDVHVQLEGQG